MQQRQIGRNGVTVSAIGLGCAALSEFYGAPDPAEARATLMRAAEAGVTLFDTADAYGSGANEQLLAAALRPWRRQITIATKFGIMRGPGGSILGTRGRPDYVSAACEASLRRLDVDCIDLYFLHRLDPDTPVEDTVGAMASLRRAGKVQHLGLCTLDPNIVRRAAAVHPITAVQAEFSPATRDAEAALLPVLRELGIGLVAAAPLSRGLLAGSVPATLAADDIRRTLPRFSETLLPANLAMAGRFAELAAARHCTPAQLALAWVLARGSDIVPVPGCTNPRLLAENLRAATLSLTAEEIAAIDTLLPPGAFAGAIG